MLNIKKWLVGYKQTSYLGRELFRVFQRTAPFSSISEYKEHTGEARANLRKLSKVDLVLLLFFVLDSIMLIATAIYAPQVTLTRFYTIWECVQLMFLFFLAYHFSHRPQQPPKEGVAGDAWEGGGEE